MPSTAPSWSPEHRASWDPGAHVPWAPGEVLDELARLCRAIDEVPLPPPRLPGWQSLAAFEYEGAVHRLQAALAEAAAVLARAGASG